LSNRTSSARGRLLPAALAAALLGACVDAPSALLEPGTVPEDPVFNASSVAPRVEFEGRARFALALGAQGSFKPGHPLHLTLEATATRATADGELRVTLPEISSAEDRGWDIVQIPVNEELRPHLRVRRAFAPGESVRERVSLTIPEPGYYNVVVTGYAHADPANPDPLASGDVSRRDFWIWVDEHGGRITDSFDTTLIASGNRKEPGPRASEKKPPRVRTGDVTIACSVSPSDPLVPSSTPGSALPSAGDATTTTDGCPPPYNPNDPTPPPPPNAIARVKATYVDAGAASAVRPVRDARVVWTILSLTGAELSSGAGTLAADGTSAPIDCGAPAGQRRIRAVVYTLSQRVQVSFGTGSDAPRAGTYSAPCDGEVGVRADAEMSHLFVNLTRSAEGHNTRFGSYPPHRIYAGLYTDGRTYYHHDHPDHELHIAKDPRMIFGEYGIMVAGHEYGHQFQNRYLFSPPDTDGLMRYQVNCKTLHPPEAPSNLGCALGEAFADWYAVIVREADMPGWKSQLEANHYYKNCVPGWDATRGMTIACVDDGSIIQGAVAALLWDITDDGVSETDDPIQRSPRDLTDAMKNCRVNMSGTWKGYSGIDHVIFCLEYAAPYTVLLSSGVATLFDTRNPFPTGATAGYTFFRGSTGFRKNWLINLYSKRSSVGTSPTPRLVEPEPPPPGEEPPPSECTGCQEMY
jgi:hypothetical protein